MLTADLVPVRRRGDQLHLPRLDAARRRRLEPLSGLVHALLESLRDQPRGAVEAALQSIDIEPTDLLLWRGLCKLALDAATFEDAFATDDGGGDDAAEVAGGDETRVDAVALRAALFSRAAVARRTAGGRVGFDRDAIVEEVATDLGLTAPGLEARLFCDLPETHLLRAQADHDAEALLLRYDLGCQQAVLLRALRVEVDVHTRDGAALRSLFHWLKFRRLLWRCERLPRPASTNGAPVRAAPPAVRLQIDGPAAIYAQSTRYGVQLAQLLPALQRFERWQLRADLRWGRQQPQALRYTLEGGSAATRSRSRGDAGGGAAGDAATAGASPGTPPAVADEVQRLCDDIERLDAGWTARPSAEIEEVPGLGVFVADLELQRGDGGRVWVEIMGFWSRDAVFQRAELLRRGLAVPVLLLASERLRVDERVVDSDNAALLLYKGVISAKRVIAAAAALLAGQAAP